MALPEPGPLPPADFAARDLLIDVVPAGTRLVRIHRNDLGPLHFGVSGGNRFDDPAGAFGVCYFAETEAGAFAETCLRRVGATLVALSFLQQRSFAAIEATSALRLLALHGRGLARAGATAAVTSGPHPVAQRWSRAAHDHPTGVDGIRYRSNHDNGAFCVALFERAAPRVAWGGSQPMTADRAGLAALLDRYRVGLG